MAPHARLGWLFLVIGLLAWYMFGRHADWRSLYFLRQPLEQAQGIVVNVTRSGFTMGDEMNGAPIQAVSFEFLDPTGIRRTGRSWTEGATPGRGDQVRIEFVSSQPAISRIATYRSGPLPVWAGAVLLFPLFGLNCIIRAVFADQAVSANGRASTRNRSEPRDAPRPANGAS